MVLQTLLPRLELERVLLPESRVKWAHAVGGPVRAEDFQPV